MKAALAHLVGDYIFQSHWMAQNKTRSHQAALAHVATYALAFVPLKPTVRQWVIILGTHYLIDRYRLARYVVWAKNGATGPITATGYPEDVPPWLATWLLIIADNVIHLAINEAVLE